MTKNSGNATIGIIFDVQHYALYDGPGIRTCVFFKGCPLKCPWCHNPESQAPGPQMSYFGEKCALCGACVKACRAGALAMNKKRIVRRGKKCIVCGRCAAVCPTGAMERIGEEAGVSEVADRVERDRPFYENSGGGATITGGEAALQPGFLISLLAELKSRGIHTALETCGLMARGLAAELVENVNLFLFDIKIADTEEHNKLTGVGNKIIVDNFKYIISTAGASRVTARVPLIPGVNTDDKQLRAIAALLDGCGYEGAVHLMPYNGMAKTKWEKIGRGGEYINYGSISEADIERAVMAFESSGYRVYVNR